MNGTPSLWPSLFVCNLISNAQYCVVKGTSNNEHCVFTLQAQFHGKMLTKLKVYVTSQELKRQTQVVLPVHYTLPDTLT